MIFNFQKAVVAAAMLLLVTNVAADERIERISALVNYVGADYHLAVAGGQVVAQSELDEQLGLLRGVRDSAQKLDGLSAAHKEKLLAELDQLIALVDKHADEADVVAKCRQVFRFLVDELGLTLAPSAPYDKVRARAVFATACASCHGLDGRADTPAAKALRPPPASFLDGDRMSRISPTLAYQAISFGVDGTAMTSFSSLPSQDRWNLAFYVVALRHAPPAGAALPGNLPPALDGYRNLALHSDRELASALQTAGVANVDATLALLRTGATAAPATTTSGFVVAREKLDKVTSAPDRAAARELIIAAYLDGIEPEEAALKAANPELASTIEGAFNSLRQEAETHDPRELGAAVSRIAMLIDSAQHEQKRGGKLVPFLGALTIALREGFEISLLVAALLAFVRKSGQGARARIVHYGWLAAIPAGVLTWFVIGRVMSGAARELSEAILTLSAAVMLLFVSHVVLGAEESRRWLKFLERRTKAAGQSVAPAWPLFTLAFIAAYREAVEVVLFFRSLVLQSPDGVWAIVGGCAVGVGGLFAVVKMLDYIGKRLSPRPVMLASGIVLTVLAVALVGQGVHALQSGGYVGLGPVPLVPTVAVLGLYATWQTLVAQLLTVAFIVTPIVRERAEKRAKAAAQLSTSASAQR